MLNIIHRITVTLSYNTATAVKSLLIRVRSASLYTIHCPLYGNIL